MHFIRKTGSPETQLLVCVCMYSYLKRRAMWPTTARPMLILSDFDVRWCLKVSTFRTESTTKAVHRHTRIIQLSNRTRISGHCFISLLSRNILAEGQSRNLLSSGKKLPQLDTLLGEASIWISAACVRHKEPWHFLRKTWSLGSKLLIERIREENPQEML